MLGNTRKQQPTLLQSYKTHDHGANLGKKSTNCLRLSASLTAEIKRLNIVFIKNNYSIDFIERTIYIKPNDSSNNSYTTTATIPYLRGISETIARILRPYNVRVAHKLMFTLRRLLTNVKGKDKPEDRPGAVYKIKCSDCRNLTARLNEQKRGTKKGDLNNNIAEHHLKTSHIIDWICV